MKSAPDMRIPVLFGRPMHTGGGEANDAWLVEDGATMPPDGYAVRFALPAQKFGAAGSGHSIGCACCTLRGPAADALTRMFRERAIGAAPFFKRIRVLASPAGEAAVRDALQGDVVTAARYVQSG
jgi:hypothetical protein